MIEVNGTAVLYMMENHSVYADLVECTWCGAKMVINIGEDICPACHTEGYLAWIDGKPQEVEV